MNIPDLTLAWHAKSILELRPNQCRYSTTTTDDEDGYPVHMFVARLRHEQVLLRSVCGAM
jgi:hypothetical protein